jgi:cobalt-zinc-cadmium efflux system protein
LLEDVLGWAAVLAGAVVIHFTGWALVDPLLSVAINIYVLYNALGTLRKGTGILMQRLPEGFDEAAVTKALLELPQVIDAHDQHAWTLDGQYTVLTVHLRTPASDAAERAALIRTARQRLKDLGVHHATIELEAPGEACELEHH